MRGGQPGRWRRLQVAGDFPLLTPTIPPKLKTGLARGLTFQCARWRRVTATRRRAFFPASNGEQDEIGVKLTLLDGRLTLSGARFDLRQVNISEADPNRPGFRVPAGERTTKGYDLTAALSPTDDWQIVGGYSHAASTVTASLQAINIGLARVGVPDYRWKLWTRYRFSHGLLKGLAIGAGTNYVAERSVRFATGTAAALSLPRYRLFDAMASYRWGRHLSLQLNLKNLADEKYYPNGNANRFVVGEPRTISVSTGYRF